MLVWDGHSCLHPKSAPVVSRDTDSSSDGLRHFLPIASPGGKCPRELVTAAKSPFPPARSAFDGSPGRDTLPEGLGSILGSLVPSQPSPATGAALMMLIWSKYTKDTRELQQELRLCQTFRKSPRNQGRSMPWLTPPTGQILPASREQRGAEGCQHGRDRRPGGIFCISEPSSRNLALINGF